MLRASPAEQKCARSRNGNKPNWPAVSLYCKMAVNLPDARMASYYLWIKALHIAFMVTWFAGLFYLPRLFIYHAETADADGRARFQVMERRLFIMTVIGMTLTWVFGLALATLNPAVLKAHWFSIKIALVVGLMFYQYRCWLWIGRLRDSAATQETRWLRWFNEIPVLVLLSVVFLAVVKP